jgi:hypothetical protein
VNARRCNTSNGWRQYVEDPEVACIKWFAAEVLVMVAWALNGFTLVCSTCLLQECRPSYKQTRFLMALLS